jgi:hypothetical protein
METVVTRKMSIHKSDYIVLNELILIIKRIILVKSERKRKKGRPRMRWMDVWCGEEFEEFGRG